VKLKSGC